MLLSKGQNVKRNWAVALVLDESWFTGPIKERSSVREEGVGKLVIALVMAGSIWYPSFDRINPVKVTVG